MPWKRADWLQGACKEHSSSVAIEREPQQPKPGQIEEMPGGQGACQRGSAEKAFRKLCKPLILIGSEDHVRLVVGICTRFNRNRGLTANIHGLMPYICWDENKVSRFVINNNLAIGSNKSAGLPFQDLDHSFRTVAHIPKPLRSSR